MGHNCTIQYGMFSAVSSTQVFVRAFVSDGAASNRKFYSLHGEGD